MANVGRDSINFFFVWPAYPNKVMSGCDLLWLMHDVGSQHIRSWTVTVGNRALVGGLRGEVCVWMVLEAEKRGEQKQGGVLRA